MGPPSEEKWLKPIFYSLPKEKAVEVAFTLDVTTPSARRWAVDLPNHLRSRSAG
jgi:hypothetical protein